MTNSRPSVNQEKVPTQDVEKIQDLSTSKNSSSYSFLNHTFYQDLVETSKAALKSLAIKLPTKAVIYPFSTTLTRFQGNNERFTYDSMIKVWREATVNGYKPLYGGLGYGLTHTALSGGIKLIIQPTLAHEFYKHFQVSPRDPKAAFWVNGLATLPCSLLELAIYPLTTYEVRAQQGKEFARGLENFRGASTVVLKNSIGLVGLFGGAHWSMSKNKEAKPSLAEAVQASIFGVSLSQLIKTPPERVRKYAQTKNLSFGQAFIDILMKENFFSLWKGLSLKMWTSMFNQVPAFAVYLFLAPIGTKLAQHFPHKKEETSSVEVTEIANDVNINKTQTRPTVEVTDLDNGTADKKEEVVTSSPGMRR